MRSRHFYYAFLILDILYRVCYYNVVGRMNLQDIIINGGSLKWFMKFM